VSDRSTFSLFVYCINLLHLHTLVNAIYWKFTLVNAIYWKFTLVNAIYWKLDIKYSLNDDYSQFDNKCSGF